MKTIEVWADYYFLPEPQKIGVLTANTTKGKEIFSFEYEKSWLQGDYKFQFDPDLQLYEGRFYPTAGFENFGVFLDSSPDRWGRTLMLRREAHRAKLEKRKANTLLQSDFLLGVYDKNRMGGLRFKVDGIFKDNDHTYTAPPWATLRELENTSLKLEQEGIEDDPKFSEYLKLLFAPGSSLGGARPKASVVDPDGHLWIAKFPSKDDLKDVGGWEAVVYELARRCGLTVPLARVEKFGSKHHTYLVKRFDRLKDGKRVHFASAMTLLQHKDGDNHQSGASYLELVDFIISSGAPSKVNRDLEELWKRIVFSITVSNSDDHLRNHGFLLSEEGWELSPAYDINPNEMAHGLSLNISSDSNALDFELAKSVAKDFRIEQTRADEIFATIKKEVSGWDGVADGYGIPRTERKRLADAFRLCISIFILSYILFLNLTPSIANDSTDGLQTAKSRPLKKANTATTDSDANKKDDAPPAQLKTEYRHWRLMGGLFYLWRSVKALQPPSTSSASTSGNSMHLFGAMGSATYFSSPHFGFGLNGGAGKGELLAVELELLPTTLGKDIFDFALLGGIGIFSANGADGTLLRLQMGGRTSLNLSPTMGISGAFRFAPFASTAGNTLDLFSLGDLLQMDIGVFWRL